MPDPAWKPRAGQSIDALYAWVAREPDGGEGVIAAVLPGMPGITPLIGADMDRIRSYRPFAMMVDSFLKKANAVRMLRLLQAREGGDA